MHAVGDLMQVVAAGVADGHDAQKRQAYTRDTKAEQSPAEVFTRDLAHCGRKNKVACSEKEGKEHQTDGYKSVFITMFHGKSPEIFVLLQHFLEVRRHIRRAQVSPTSGKSTFPSGV